MGFIKNCLKLPHLTKDSFRQELLAAITTFLTMSYIVIVNPTILASPGTEIPFEGVLTATVLITVLSTLIMGAYAGLPYAVAPGMGINAFFTYTIILQEGVPWPTAFGMVFWSGVIFLILSVTPLRAALLKSLPATLRHAAAVGIGLFLTFIGLKNAGLVVVHPETFVTFGPLGVDQVLVVVGLIVAIFLMNRKSPFAFLAAIALVTVVALLTGRTEIPKQLVSAPDFTSVFFKLDIWDALQLSLLPAIFSFMFTDLFDSISTFAGLAQASGLKDQDDQPLRLRESLIADAWGTLLAGVFGTSSGTTYIESAAGVETGGRTGWTAVFIAILFIPCFFIAPLVKMVPGIATAPVLIIVGYLMFSDVRSLSSKNIEEAFPAFLTAILIPLTFSITTGLLWGITSYLALHVLVGKAKQVPKALWVVGLCCVVMMVLQSH